MTDSAPNSLRTFSISGVSGDVNLGADLSGSEAAARGKAQRLTFGLNFRPTEDTVFKLDRHTQFRLGILLDLDHARLAHAGHSRAGGT